MADGAPSWHEKILDLYGEGGGDAEAAKELGVTLRKFDSLILEQPAFAEIIDQCRTLSRAWWESQARKNLWNKDFNTPLWNFNMKNRFGWADKSEVKEEKNQREMTLDEMRAEILKRNAKLVKKIPELGNNIVLMETSRSADE